MEFTSLNNILQWWERSYYTIPILFCCIVICFISGLKYYHKSHSHILFLVYSLIGAILCPGFDILFNSYESIDSEARTKIVETGNLIFAIFEFASFCSFFLTILENKTVNKIIRVLIISFISLSLILLVIIHLDLVSLSMIKTISFRLNSIEFLLLLFPCLVFFYEEMQRDNKLGREFKLHSGVWVSIGLFVYIIVSLPFIFIGDYLYKNFDSLYRLMFSIHFISISFLYLCLAKSFSCRLKIMK